MCNVYICICKYNCVNKDFCWETLLHGQSNPLLYDYITRCDFRVSVRCCFKTTTSVMYK